MQEHNDLDIICPQHEYKYVLKETANGDVVREQCGCGFISSNSLKKSNFELDRLERWDEILFEKYLERQSDNCRRKREESKLSLNDTEYSFWNQYSLYLQSDAWKHRRRLVLERDNNTCQACLSATAEEVHYLTYKHVFNEPLFDLVAVCKPCHDGITKMDRQLR